MTKVLSAPFLELENFTLSVEQYDQMVDTGIITPDHKVELLEGLLIKKMGINEPHSACVAGLHEYFYDRHGKQFTFRSENPITLSPTSKPEPDFVVCTRREDRYVNAHPSAAEVQLLIEVAESSVDNDRSYKSRLYAAAGIQEYWIINLAARQVEVYLKPDDSSATFASVTYYGKEETFESILNGETAVSDLLPF